MVSSEASSRVLPPAQSSNPGTGTHAGTSVPPATRRKLVLSQHPSKPYRACMCCGEASERSADGGSPNKSVRSPLGTYLLDQHFQNHQEPREGSGKGTEADDWREIAPYPAPNLSGVPGKLQEEQGKGLLPLQTDGAKGASWPTAASPGTNGAWGAAAAGRGPRHRFFPAASRTCPAPHLPRRDPRPDRRRRGRIRGAAAAAARRWERRRREAASGSPGCDGRAGAVRTGAPRCCRCPGRGGDATAGDSEPLFGSVRKVTAATRPTLNPPPRRTWGREKEEERGRRQGWGLAADQSPAQHQVTTASLGLSLRCSAPVWLRFPWILACTRGTRGQFQSAETFPFPVALIPIFGSSVCLWL